MKQKERAITNDEGQIIEYNRLWQATFTNKNGEILCKHKFYSLNRNTALGVACRLKFTAPEILLNTKISLTPLSKF